MTDVVCCPLSNDGDGPSCHSQRTRKARKPHRCSECREEIPAGAAYEYVSGIWDGSPSVFKTCPSCVEIRKHFACGGGWVYGELWNQLEENFYPDMKAGGPCMAGLSPEAKGRLFERRLKWLEAVGEINDSVWDGWTPDKPPKPLPQPKPDARTVLFDAEDDDWA